MSEEIKKESKPIKVKRLRIECNNKYTKSEGEKEYSFKDVYEGNIEFSNEYGSIDIKIDEELCNIIIAACLSRVNQACEEQIKKLKEVFVHHVEKIENSLTLKEGDKVLLINQKEPDENGVAELVKNKEGKLIPILTKFIKKK